MTRLKRLMALVRSARGVDPNSRGEAARTLIKGKVTGTYRAVKRRFARAQVRLVEKVFGVRRANRVFWRALGREPVWFDVQQRFERLAERRSATDVRHFVTVSLDRASDAMTLIGLACHPAAAEHTRYWMTSVLPELELKGRVTGRPQIGGGIVAAARILLEPDEAAVVFDRVAGLYDVLDTQFYQVADSVGYRHSGGPKPGHVAKRLIITESLRDADAVALLLPGADSVTLIETADTFGRADFEAYRAWPALGSIEVEHVRSRMTRFSEEYHDLHEATAAVAREVVRSVGSIGGLLEDGDRPFLEVEIADFLFFQALKVRALELLVEDGTFDEIVVGIGNHTPGSEFLALLRDVEGLLEDPRTEIASIARGSGRAAFWRQLDSLYGPRPQRSASVRGLPIDVLVRNLDAQSDELAAALPSFPDSGRSRVLLVTANNAAYVWSAAAYASLLRDTMDVDMLHVGRNGADLAVQLGELGAADVPIHFLAMPTNTVDALANQLTDRARERAFAEPTGPAGRVAVATLATSISRLNRTTVAPALLRMRTARRWLARIADLGELPDALVLSPNRSMGVTSLVPAAREAGLPSIVLEPHAQDSNYSRYSKVAGDYYGVLSKYFAANAAQGFGLPSDRIFIVGSPRLVAPAGYDPAAAKREARAAFSAGGVADDQQDAMRLVFFCQPLDWTHLAKVWANVLHAARAAGWRVLLKTHPEDSVDRTQRYLALADEMGMSDRITRLDCDPATAIALADLASTAYSTAAVDAAIRLCSVVVVTDGDVDYPLDVSSMIDADVARSAEELADLLRRYEADPSPFAARARAFLEREPQFLDGPGPRLRELVEMAIAAGSAGIRPEGERLRSLFLDGPHPVFEV